MLILFFFSDVTFTRHGTYFAYDEHGGRQQQGWEEEESARCGSGSCWYGHVIDVDDVVTDVKKECRVLTISLSTPTNSTLHSSTQ